MNKIPIIYFHSVAPVKSPQWYRSYLTFELTFFEDIIKYLVRNRYRFVLLDEYFTNRNHFNKNIDKLICLTFDDGYLDNYVFVYPILKKYEAKATIFINPDYVQENNCIRPTLEDVWEKKNDLNDLPGLGFASWSELIEMQRSGIMDIQSHTMTHTKYYVSDKITDFHNPRSDYLYPISNRFPSKRPYYINDPDFIKLIPWGTPFFEEKSSLIAQIVSINESFEMECIKLLEGTDLNNYSFEKCLNTVRGLYNSYRATNSLITCIENKHEYLQRVRKELLDSKSILEKKLAKTISHCCWPHGDYNEICHQEAINMGYKSSLIVLKPGEENKFTDRYDRIGCGPVFNNSFLTLLKTKYKINAYRNTPPYNWVMRSFNKLKYGI
jgi:hypothetical protein